MPANISYDIICEDGNTYKCNIFRHENGVISEIEYKLNGFLSFPYGPAHIQWYSTGSIKSIEWFNRNTKNGKPEKHRLDGPACELWHENGHKRIEQWVSNDKLHRLNGPAIIHWDENGKLEREEWYREGEHSKLKNKPLLVKYYPNGKIRSKMCVTSSKQPNEVVMKEYNENGVQIVEKYYSIHGNHVGFTCHNNNGPAIIEYHSNKSIKSKSWIVDGKYNRLYAPAIIEYDDQGSVVNEHWMVDDRSIDDEVNEIFKSINLTGSYENWSDEDKMIFKLIFDGWKL